MKNFVIDMNAKEEIARLEKQIKPLEKKAKKSPLSDEDTKNLSEYKNELISLKIKDSVIKNNLLKLNILNGGLLKWQKL